MELDRVLTHVRKLPVKKASRVTVYLVGIGGDDVEDLGDFRVNDYEGEAVKDLAQEMLTTGQHDCDERGGTRKYRAVGRDEEGKEVYKWNMRFRAQAADGQEVNQPGLELDEPTVQGWFGQKMRHDERMFNAQIGALERVIKLQQEQVETAYRRIATLEKRELEVIEMMRTLKLNTSDDLSADRNASRVDKAIDLLAEKFLPAAGIQLGLLPKGFDLTKSIADLEQSPDENKPNGKSEETVEPPAAE